MKRPIKKSISASLALDCIIFSTKNNTVKKGKKVIDNKKYPFLAKGTIHGLKINTTVKIIAKVELYCLLIKQKINSTNKLINKEDKQWSKNKLPSKKKNIYFCSPKCDLYSQKSPSTNLFLYHSLGLYL